MHTKTIKELSTLLHSKAISATELATLFYLAIIGSSQALSRPSNPPRLKEHLRGIIASYLIHRP